MPKVIIPPPYRGVTEGLVEVPVPGDTVRACLEAVIARFASFGELVLAPDGSLQAFVNVFVNGDKLPKDRALEARVSAEDTVEVISAIAGG